MNALLMLLTLCSSTPYRHGDGETYTNPVGDQPIHMGDPFVLQHENSYYLYGTNASNEGFKYWQSSDLVHWIERGWVYRETEQSWAKSHYWAPEVKFYRGKFYMTYSAMSKAGDTQRLLLALAVSDRPSGPYRDLRAPWFDFGYSAIDGHLFVDDDDQPYLYFSRNGVQDGYSYGMLYGVALSDDLATPIGQPQKLLEADQPWEKVRYGENRCNEGAFVIKHAGRYYMTYSANHTAFPDYGIGYATADQPLGPWVKAKENPIAATHREVGVSGPGHSCLTWSPDKTEMFIVYHTHADAERPSGDRVVNIDRIAFDALGRLKITGPTRTAQPMPSSGDIVVGPAQRDDDGFLAHRVQSPYQAAATQVRVLLPDDLVPGELVSGQRYPVIYVLPVEPGRATRYGDGLVEVRKQNLQNKFGAIFVGPTFSDLPWYADHPANPQVWQETYFLSVVVPLVERSYPVSTRPADRLLLGFSKSGWGAWSLLLRHLDLFGRAAAWDAPLMMTEIGQYGDQKIFGTQENFAQYRLIDLLRKHAPQLRQEKRLVLTGYGNFQQHHQQAHALLEELRIPHDYRNGPQRKHDWHSGWVAEAVEQLMADRSLSVNH